MSPAKRRSKATAAAGPRGGETTVTPGGFTRMSAYMDPRERAALRKKAFVEDRSVSDVIRSAVRGYLGLE